MARAHIRRDQLFAVNLVRLLLLLLLDSLVQLDLVLIEAHAFDRFDCLELTCCWLIIGVVVAF